MARLRFLPPVSLECLKRTYFLHEVLLSMGRTRTLVMPYAVRAARCSALSYEPIFFSFGYRTGVAARKVLNSPVAMSLFSELWAALSNEPIF